MTAYPAGLAGLPTTFANPSGDEKGIVKELPQIPVQAVGGRAYNAYYMTLANRRAMLSRFSGDSGRRLRVDAFKNQTLVAGNNELAEKLADIAELIEVAPGTSIIRQDDYTNDIFFILVGSFSVIVNGREVATRGSGDHVGEMGAIEPTQRTRCHSYGYTQLRSLQRSVKLNLIALENSILSYTNRLLRTLLVAYFSATD